MSDTDRPGQPADAALSKARTRRVKGGSRPDAASGDAGPAPGDAGAEPAPIADRPAEASAPSPVPSIGSPLPDAPDGHAVPDGDEAPKPAEIPSDVAIPPRAPEPPFPPFAGGTVPPAAETPRPSEGRRLALVALVVSVLLPAALYAYLASEGVFDTGRLATLESSVAALRAAPPPKAEVARADLDGLAARIDRLEKTVAALGQRPATPAASGVPASALNADVDARLAPLDTKVDDLAKRLAAVEQSLAARSKASSNAPSLLVLARTITTDLKIGEPYAGELDTLARLGADPAQVEALRPFAEKGAPLPAALSSQFQAELAAARAKVEASERPSGLWNKILGALGSLVRVRRLGADESGTPAGIVEAALGRGDTAAALDAWNGLPVFEKTSTPASGARIKALAAAAAAARAIGASALDAIRRAGSAANAG